MDVAAKLEQPTGLTKTMVEEFKQANSYAPIPTMPQVAHRCFVEPNVVPTYPGRATTGESAYKFRVVCSCQWQALARERGQANAYRVAHLRQHSELIPEDQNGD